VRECAVYADLDLPVSLAGYIALTVSFFTMLSCLMSTRLTKKFGTGNVAVFSTALTALALLGLSFSKNAVYFFLLSFTKHIFYPFDVLISSYLVFDYL
jgi:hypothetical protein